MPTNQTDPSGISRNYDASHQQKWVFILLHLVILLICAWLIYLDGWAAIGRSLGNNWALSDPTRATILYFCAVLYWLRHVLTLFYLLARKIDWSEVFGLLLFFAFFEIGLILLGGGAFRENAINFSWLDYLAFILLGSGSFFNSYSELQRKWWKRDPANRRRCYSKGLFSQSMHINYFGDLVLFSGWCLLTHNLWSLVLPLLMAYSFIVVHIPGLDNHLNNRYGEDFKTYASKTKRLIPYIY